MDPWMKPQDDATTWVAALGRAHVSGARGNDPCLVTIYGPGLGTKRSLGPAETLIGRGSSCDLSISLSDISRRHCRVLVREDQMLLEDLGSTNGTWLNDEAIEPGIQVPIRSGDHINLGGVIFKVLDGGNVEAQYHEELYRTAIIDGLTQIPNRRYLTEFLEREISRAERHDRPLALLLFDVDEFKSVNDEFGHVAGDQVLREIADCVRQMVRTECCFARYGGEEFAMVIPECSHQGALVAAERVRGTIETHEFRIGDRRVPVTVSVGVAVIHDEITDPVQLFHEADERLYEAKHAGRNRVAAGPAAQAGGVLPIDIGS
jgi:diguanylate cyclase (GGDEF)-like protein